MTVLLFTSTALMMSSCCIQALRIEVFPRKPLFRLAERHQLVCLVQDCSTVPSISWTLLGDRPLTATVSTNETQSVVTFDPVMMEHEGALLCKASCGEEKKQTRTNVQVYCEYSDWPVLNSEVEDFSLVGFHQIRLHVVLRKLTLMSVCLQPSHQPLSSQVRTVSGLGWSPPSPAKCLTFTPPSC